MTDLPFVQIVPVALRGLDTSTSNGIDIEKHLNAAIDWIQCAHRAAGDGGISKGYDLLRSRWVQSYPETTGYTIPSLLNLAILLKRPELRQLAFSLADYLLQNVTPEGGVVHWQAGSKADPIVFDTGQVMFGWLAAYEASNDGRYLDAAVRAGDWLASIQDASGSWIQFQHLGVKKVIDTRVAWALLRLYRHSSDDRHLEAAVRNLDWAVQQQDPDGWFRHCAFLEDEDPFTHTLAYTAEGLFECGQLLQEDRYLAASRLTADALLARQRSDGSLASLYASGWRETSRSSCLTGNCQMARLWLSFYQVTNKQDYTIAAEQAITFVTRTQNVRTSNPNIRGGIAGSYPIYGCYERFKYPNWAAKFFVDALLALAGTKKQEDLLVYVG
ncbi:MAG: hypothetical protein AB1801_13725 [Chloroflexota bacterium]